MAPYFIDRHGRLMKILSRFRPRQSIKILLSVSVKVVIQAEPDICRDKRLDLFDYIEMFYNPKRKHARNGMLSPANFEGQQAGKLQGV